MVRRRLRVLVACEFSGAVRDAFIALGHDAVSCDLLPSETNGPHIQGDVLTILNQGWDLMVAHPPCTFLANSGVRWLYGGKGRRKDPARWRGMREGAVFFKELLNAPIKYVAVENPIIHGYAKEIIGREPNQIFQPWMFGHGETKATCLWLKGLPALQPTRIVSGRKTRIFYEARSPDRWKNRSRTLPGVARAMATQWSRYMQETPMKRPHLWA